MKPIRWSVHARKKAAKREVQENEVERSPAFQVGARLKRRELIKKIEAQVGVLMISHRLFESRKVLIKCHYEHGQRNPSGDSNVITPGNRANPHVD